MRLFPSGTVPLRNEVIHDHACDLDGLAGEHGWPEFRTAGGTDGGLAELRVTADCLCGYHISGFVDQDLNSYRSLRF